MNYETLNTVLEVLSYVGSACGKAEKINCVLHLANMCISQKGKGEHSSILTLKPCLPSGLLLIFSPHCNYSVELLQEQH